MKFIEFNLPLPRAKNPKLQFIKFKLSKKQMKKKTDYILTEHNFERMKL